MKKAFTIISLLIAGSIAFSQQLNITQFATLNHNDTITAFYGPNAFESAHVAAMHGDVITLSPGTFNAANITKAVIIRGAGMMKDNISNTLPTKIQNDFLMDVPSVAEKKLIIEGVYFTGRIIYRNATNPSFNKCRFNVLNRHSFDGNWYIPVFTNCIIDSWDGSTIANNPMFINSIILDVRTDNNWDYYWSDAYGGFWNNHGQYLCGQSFDTYYNCIINIPPNNTNNKRNIINCITYSTNISSGNGSSVYNTIGITDSTNFYSTTTEHGNTNVNGFESIFKTFRGTYTDGETFELTDEAAATYIGSDGNQVGIYGGSAVFNPKATDMRIRKYSVGFYSDENGQLKITTELENE